MKFGKNLAHLSIPEWRVYNLDYNDLKSCIRDVTRNNNPNLSNLRQKFLENFDYLNLFVTTKSGELARKLKASQHEFQIIQNSPDDSSAAKLAKLGALNYQIINDISIELRKLTKFILVQKIAVKKIFKKFAKHYPDENASRNFIASLHQVLQTNPSSFINVDLTLITSQLLLLLEDLDHELRYLLELLHKKPVYLPLPHGELKKTHSTTTIKTTRSSLASATSSPENVHIDPLIDNSIDQVAKFDLITKVKKNFHLQALILRDISSRNDVGLSMHVYLNIPQLSDQTRISAILLTEGTDDDSPSYIVSYDSLPISVVVAHTGGLRKYSYCCLPNSIIESILHILKQENIALKKELENLLYKLINTKTLSAMAQTTINTLLLQNLTPSLKMVCDRTRYFVRKDQADEDIDPGDDTKSASPLDSIIDPENKTASTVDTKVYEDNYFMTLDENIHTSNSFGNKISFDTSDLDPFPFNIFSIHSNDSNLHNFEATLSSTIDDNVLQSKYREITMRKMPVKVQNLLGNTSVHLFKNLSIYDYMRSCYHNIIPDDQNNHYSKLLNINLLKNFENVDIVNRQNSVDDSIIQDKARSILRRQMSCKSLQDFTLGQAPNSAEENRTADERLSRAENVFETESAVKERAFPGQGTMASTYHAYDNSQLALFQKFNDLENLDYDDEDSYFVYLSFNNELDDSWLNNILLSFIKFKHRMRRALDAFDLRPNHTRLWRSPKEKLLPDREAMLNYDSINEDPTFFNNVNDYQIQLIYDYDHVLSVVYFTLCFSALFIAGINLGIVYGLLKIQLDNRDVYVVSNPLMMIMLVFGYLVSLVLSMTSINLNFQRFRSTPAVHLGIIWAGFLGVVATVIWSFMALFS